MCEDTCVDVDKPSCCCCCNKDLCYATCWSEEFFRGQEYVAPVKKVKEVKEVKEVKFVAHVPQVRTVSFVPQGLVRCASVSLPCHI